MRLIIHSSAGGLRGRVSPPPDKSISHRALMLGALANGVTTIENMLFAGDTLHTAAALQSLGVNIAGIAERGAVTVTGAAETGLRPAPGDIYLGNSGTSMRLLAGILAACDFESRLTGDESLSSRPMDRVAVPLRMMGARVEGRDDRCLPPLCVRGGKLDGIEYALPVASAQVKSCLLLAGLRAEGQTTVIERAPSRDHTERMLAYFGAEVHTDGPAISVRGGAALQGRPVLVPGDISGAAFWLVAGAIIAGSDIVIERVGVNPLRSGILDALRSMGAALTVFSAQATSGEPAGDIRVRPHALKAAQIGGAMIPRLIDEIPVLCVAAALADGRTEIRDAHELRVKESDRIATIAEGLSLMGASVQPTPDGLTVEGPRNLRGARVGSHGDHRVAMALAIAGLAAQGETIIEGAECIRTSYPGFAQHLRALGAIVREEE